MPLIEGGGPIKVGERVSCELPVMKGRGRRLKDNEESESAVDCYFDDLDLKLGIEGIQRRSVHK